ncbi:MAG: STAS domain-containing protein [Leptospiraceae bacterium]|nr:STAS domain-containing protein [Leptospiraceae bacterium]MCP5513279.1 STAS domain-containing protein [Leptospiraceae bacterium]
MNLDDINVYVEKIENISVMRVEGSITSYTCEHFLEEVRYSNRKGGLIIDMEEVVAISSKGVDALKQISDLSYTSGNKIVLLNLSHNVKQVLNMLGLYKVFNIAPNEELAMKMASKQSK